ncbi:MAG: polysaccharide deacetylase family protein [Acidipropionibacterium sp.]|jgi:peptidoglycan/xylan/chitin deacetylase (PgdA/CDA1 family)|nr:polysaccharide deacetylase family protein [Acidipropionibacterium sp.]
MILNNQRLYYAPMPLRPRVTWPEGKTVAFWHAPNVEHYDFLPAGGASPQSRVGAPDVQHYMHRDYGNRTGFWRMLRAVDEYQIPSTVSLSLTVLESIPEVRDAMKERDWEIMTHGISNLRTLYDMPYEEEEEFYRLNQELARTYYGGVEIKGMLGPKISGTDNTCDLMVEHGMTYHADWIHDEQPRPLRTRSGRPLVSMPYSFMLNDVPMLHVRNLSGEDFVAMAKAQLERSLRDADEDGQARVVCLATHPFLFGQPHLQRYLEEIFDMVRSDDRIWVTQACEIADHYIENFYDEQVTFADGLAKEQS